MKKPIKSIVTSSLFAVAFGALSVGSTFALFTSQSKTEVNVGAGEVKLGQTLAIQSVSELGNAAVAADANGVYTNSIGGKTYVDEDNPLLVHLEKWAPGDKAVIKITNNNYSNVTIKTRFRVSHTSTSTPDLWGALTKTYAAVDANNQDIGYKFMDWSPVEPTVSKISDITVTITFPDHDAGEIKFGTENQDNQYQNCNCSIMFTQEAVQGNAQTDGILDQMNAALDAAAATAGINKTMHDALLDIYAAMQDLDLDLDEDLIKTAGYVWNVNTDHFYYGQENTTNEYFKIYDQIPSPQTNSIYASSTWNVAEVNLTGVGFDAGSASGITAINYVGAEQARSNVIRTNSAGTTLTINAPQDTVKHYGEAGFLNIIAVANSSYHEHGYIPQAQIAKGRVVNEVGTVEVEGGATKPSGVENLFIVAATAGSGTVAGTFNEIIVEAAQGASVPALDRTDVNIVGAVLVVEVKTAQSDDFVYLTKSGIVEQVVVTSEKGNTDTATEEATYGTDDALNDASSKAAYEIANIVKRGENGRPVKDDGVTEMNEDEVAAIETVNDIVIEEPKASIDDIAKSEGDNASYAGGAGTKTNPYLISSEDWWMKFVGLCKDDSDYSETAGKYFKVITDLDLSAKQERANIHYFGGSIDFGNKIFTGLTPANVPTSDVGDDGISAIFSLIKGEVSISNLKFITTKIVNGGHTVAAQITGVAGGDFNATFENIVLLGSATGININNNGLLMSYVYGPTANFVIKNVDNYANLTGTGYKSAYLGNMGYGNVKSIVIADCDNYGTIISTNKEAAMFISNPGYFNHDIIVTITSCSNHGNICQPSSFARKNLFTTRIDSQYRYIVNGINMSTTTDASFNEQIQSELTGDLVNGISTTSLATNDGEFVLTSTNEAVRYELSFSFFTGGVGAGGGAGYTMKLTPAQLSEAHIKVYDWICKAQATETIVEHLEYVNPYYTSGEHYVLNLDGYTIRDNVFVSLVAYGTSDEVLSISTYLYA